MTAVGGAEGWLRLNLREMESGLRKRAERCRTAYGSPGGRPCQRTPVPGGIAVACTRDVRARCGQRGCRRSATKLCDFPMIGGATCDAKLCDLHAEPQGPGRDYCPYHVRNHAGETPQEGR